MMKKLSLLICMLIAVFSVSAQGLLNQGAYIQVQEGTYLQVTGENGDFSTGMDGFNYGTLENDGVIVVDGDWINNSSTVFTSLNTLGTVYFSNGRNHTISGTGSTYFEQVNVGWEDTLTIPAGVVVTVRNYIMVSGLLILNGTLNVENSISFSAPVFNKSIPTSGSIEGTGTLAYTGTNPQLVVGGTFSTAIKIDNMSGCTLVDNLVIDNSLELYTGGLYIGTFDLTISEGSSVIRNGSPTGYVVANSTGKYIYEIGAAGTYTYHFGEYPVAKGAIPSYYLPVSITLTGGTYTGASLGMNYANMKHPDNSDDSNYLNRYWKFYADGMSNYSYSGTFTYNPDFDIVGTESQMMSVNHTSSGTILWNEYEQVDYLNNYVELTDRTEFTDVTAMDICGPVAQYEASPYVCDGADITLIGYDQEIVNEVDNELPLGYCTASPFNPNYIFITGLQIEDSLQTSADGGYDDFSSELFFNAYRDSSYSLSVFVDNSSTFTHYSILYIDWNRDGSFDAITESVEVGSNTGVSENMISLNIPSDAALGKTRMRVVTAINGYAEPCNNFPVGEVEDYMIEIKAADGDRITAYTWAGPDAFTSTDQVAVISEATTANSGTYYLTVNDVYGCEDNVEFNVEVVNPVISLPADTLFTMMEDTVVLEPGEFDSYLWGDASEVSSYEVEDYGWYFVTVSLHGCEANDSILINEKQDIQLEAGWQMISSYIDYSGPIEDLFADIVDDVILIKNSSGVVYWPSFPLGVSYNWSPLDGYLIKMENENLLEVYGNAVNPLLVPVPVNGVCMIPYLRKEAGAIDQIMAPYYPDFLLMKSTDGSTFWPFYSINQIGNMIPGQGYKVFTLGTFFLTYPDEILQIKANFNQETRYFGQVCNTGDNMTIGIPLSSWYSNPLPGDEVAVFNSGGKLLGASVYDGNNMAITVWGDDDLSSEKYAVSGEELSFRMYSRELGQEIDLYVSSWEIGDDLYKTDGVSVVGNIAKESIGLDQFDVYPNPCQNSITLDLFLSEDTKVEMAVYNSIGELVMPMEVSSMSEGENSVGIDMTSLQSGVYYLRLMSNDQIQNIRIVKQ